MHAAPHRTNSDFQLRHFIAGSCHTPDGAYVLLYSQRQQWLANVAEAGTSGLDLSADLQDAIDAKPPAFGADALRAQAKLARAKRAIEGHETRLAGLQAELATIDALMAELRPQCRFAHLPIMEHAEAAQRGEWLGELKRRAENMQLAALSGIAYDHLQAMRMHPDWEGEILPHLIQTRAALGAARTPDAVKAAFTPRPQFLIGHDE